VRQHPTVPSPVLIRALWAAALGALIVAVPAWVVPATPYQAPWAWISFIGMCIVDDVVLGSAPEARWGELPKVALLAAIIVFRRHPEITMLVAVTAAPLAGVLKGQRWPTQVTVTAQWLLASIIGAAAFRLVGFGDTGHFVAATAVLMVFYYLLGPVLTAFVAAGTTSGRLRDAIVRSSKLAIPMEFAGALLALAWRTPALQPASLKVADAALVAVAGFVIAFLLRERAGWLLRFRRRLPARPAVVAAFILLLSQVAPSPLSWLLPLGLAVVAGIWAVWRGVFPIACGALGAFCNESVRAVNGGYMPVEGSGMVGGIGAARTYVPAGPQTNLAWLDDRFHLPPPFPGIASAGDILIAVGMAWLIASVMAHRRRRLDSGASTGADDAAAA